MTKDPIRVNPQQYDKEMSEIVAKWWITCSVKSFRLTSVKIVHNKAR